MSEPTPNLPETPPEPEAGRVALEELPDTREPLAHLLTLLARCSPAPPLPGPAETWAPEEDAGNRPAEGPDAAAVSPGTASSPSPASGSLPGPGFRDEGDAILLLGEIVDLADPLQGLGGSAYLEQIHGLRAGRPSQIDSAAEGLLKPALAGLIRTGAIKSAQACGPGGLAVAIARGCRGGNLESQDPLPQLGATLDLVGAGHAAPIPKAVPGNTPGNNPDTSVFPPGSPESIGITESTCAPLTLGPRLDALLFGEIPSRIVLSCAPLQATCVLERARLLGIPARRLGTVGGQALTLKTGAGEFTAPVASLHTGPG